MKYSVIIVNYNSGDKLKECVASVITHNPDAEIIVVDNASTDNSLALLEPLFSKGSHLRLLKNDSNTGFAAASNQGAAEANGDYLLYLNPDCVIYPGTLQKLAASIEQYPEVGMAGGLLLNPDGSEQAGGRRAVPTPWRTLVRAFNLSALARRYPRLVADFNLHKQALPDKPVEVEAISGACMLVSRASLEEVGGLDEGYFLHCEDIDWCMRFRQKGWKILFVPDARVTHYLGACSRSRPVFVEWHKHRGMIRFYRKFFRHQYPGVLMWLVGLAVWLRFGCLALYYGATHIAKRN
jgi:GT2 family glycosyltransferase